MRILFVHEVNWRRKVTFEIHELPELLSLRGHEIDFLDFPEDQSRSGFRKLVDLKTECVEVTSRTFPGSRVRIFTPGRVLPPPVDRLVASITLIPLLIRLFRRHKYDAVFLYGVPTNGWQTILLARLFGIPVLYRGIDVAHVLRKTRLAGLVRCAERFVYRNSDAISVNNVALGRYCHSEGADPLKVTVNYAGLDRDHFHGRKDTSVLKHLYGIEEREQVILYMGTFFRFSGLDKVIREFARVTIHHDNLRLVLVGDGELRLVLEEIVAELKLKDRVIFTGLVDYHTLPDHLHLADVAISPFTPSLVTDKALPWKVVQYVAAGLPVVSTDLEGLKGLFPDNQGVVYAESVPDLLDKAVQLLADDDVVEQIRQAGETIVRQKCDWSKVALDFEQLLQKLNQSDVVKS